MMSDDHIAEEGVERKFATAVQRKLIDFWTSIHQAYAATGGRRYKLPVRCCQKSQAVRQKSYVPLVPEGQGVFTGEQRFLIEELDNIPSNRYAIEWNFKQGNYIRQIVGSSYDDLHDPSKEATIRSCPWWRSHIGDFPTHQSCRHISAAQKKCKRKNSL